MVDPVVSSKFGKRPLLEMPALHVESGTRVEVSSLQPRPKAEFGMSPNLIYRSDGLNHQQQQQTTQESLQPNPAMNIVQPLPGPLPQAQGLPAPVPGNMYVPQPGQPLYQPAPYQQPLYPQPPMLPPQMLGVPPAQAGYPMQPPMQPPMQLPPVPMYPAMQNPYQGGQGYFPQGAMPPYLQYPQPVRPHTPVPDNFRLEGVLEYGQLTTVHFRDKTTNFRGLPGFLRAELQKAYGKFPATDIRIAAVNGEFHIYASPRKDGQGDDYSDGDPGSSDVRMIGFNEIVGEPRDYSIEDKWRRKGRF